MLKSLQCFWKNFHGDFIMKSDSPKQLPITKAILENFNSSNEIWALAVATNVVFPHVPERGEFYGWYFNQARGWDDSSLGGYCYVTVAGEKVQCFCTFSVFLLLYIGGTHIRCPQGQVRLISHPHFFSFHPQSLSVENSLANPNPTHLLNGSKHASHTDLFTCRFTWPDLSRNRISQNYNFLQSEHSIRINYWLTKGWKDWAPCKQLLWHKYTNFTLHESSFSCNFCIFRSISWQNLTRDDQPI